MQYLPENSMSLLTDIILKKLTRLKIRLVLNPAHSNIIRLFLSRIFLGDFSNARFGRCHWPTREK
jgi:hypothetical protein